MLVLIWCSKNDIRVRLMLDEMVLYPLLLYWNCAFLINCWCKKSNLLKLGANQRWAGGGESGGGSPLGIWTPLILPPSNRYLPHSTIFEFDSPTSEILAPLPQKFRLPYLKKFGFCKKGPIPLVQFWWLPPQHFLVRLLYLKNFDSPSSILVTPPSRILS